MGAAHAALASRLVSPPLPVPSTRRWAVPWARLREAPAPPYSDAAALAGPAAAVAVASPAAAAASAAAAATDAASASARGGGDAEEDDEDDEADARRGGGDEGPARAAADDDDDDSREDAAAAPGRPFDSDKARSAESGRSRPSSRHAQTCREQRRRQGRQEQPMGQRKRR